MLTTPMVSFFIVIEIGALEISHMFFSWLINHASGVFGQHNNTYDVYKSWENTRLINHTTIMNILYHCFVVRCCIICFISFQSNVRQLPHHTFSFYQSLLLAAHAWTLLVALLCYHKRCPEWLWVTQST